jgi:tellurite methyltransferase
MHASIPEPAAILLEALQLLPRGRVLDLACGNGRNAIFLSARGWKVTAIDSASSALAFLRAAADAEGIDVTVNGQRNSSRTTSATSGGGLDVIEANLEEFQLPRNRFNLVVCTNYLQRSLFRAIEEALLPGGVLLYETFTRAQLQFAQGPRNPKYLLEPGELRTAFPKLTPLFFRELSAGKGFATLLARKPGEV